MRTSVDSADFIMTATSANRWSDDRFLNRLRAEGDAEADACLAQLVDNRQNFSELFQFLNSNHAQVPASAPDALQAFFARALRSPCPGGQPVEHDRLARAEDVFMTHACSSALALLAMSLPAGYAAPHLARVLVMSGDLKNHPYKRLLGVLQMVVNVTSPGGFEANGNALVTGAKLRLLHAGVRHLVRRRIPDYESRWGVPVNHEDMLATIMGFSLLVIQGLQRLNIGLTDQQAEDYFYLWRVYALTMGIHPRCAPDSTDYLPANLSEADEFYRSYARRHYRNAQDNPEGVELTRASLLMLEHIVGHTPLRWMGSRLVPRLYMQQLLGAEGLVQRGVRPVRQHAVTKWALLALLNVWTRLATGIDRRGGRHLHERVSQLFLQGLIDRTLDGEVTFLIPERLADLHALTDKVVRPFGERRRADRRAAHFDIDFSDRRGGPDRRLAFRQSFWGCTTR
jgi:hypothetical protein